MGRAARKKEEQEREQFQKQMNLFKSRTLSLKQEKNKIVKNADYYCNFFMKENIDKALRPLNSFKIKSNNDERNQLDLLRHLFSKYKCPLFLEKFILGYKYDAQRINLAITESGFAKNMFDLYFVISLGGSPYKEVMKQYLTRAETHMFLSAPNDFSVAQNIWWSRIMAELKTKGSTNHSRNLGIANAIAMSRISASINNLNSEYHMSLARFFANNIVPLTEMNDLLDCLFALKEENPNFSIKSRTIESIRQMSIVWHRTVRDIKKYRQEHWNTIGIPEFNMTTGSDKNLIEWKIIELLNGKQLSEEGNAQRHCVGSYVNKCVAGQTSIFSLRSTQYCSWEKRAITIEISKSFGKYNIVQARGFANRFPKNHETEIIKKWANENNISWSTYVF